MINFDSNLESTENLDFLTVVIVTYNRIDLLKGMLYTLRRSLSQTMQLHVNVRVGVNGLDSATYQALEDIKNSHLFYNLELYQLEKKVTPAEARNIISVDIKDKWILFLDDDIEVPDDFLKNFLILNKEKPEVGVWGGPNLTPQSSSLIEKKIGWLLQNFMIVGPVSNRYKKTKSRIFEANEFFLSLCNLFIKSDLFKENYFNPKLKTAEENDLIYNIVAKDHILMSSPLLYVWHFRRKNFSQFLIQIKNYGFGRGQIIYGSRHTMKLAMVVLAFLAMTIMIMFPVQIVKLIVAWMSLISISYFFSFKKKSVSFLFLPIRVWINYSMGILSGVWFSFRNLSS